MTPMIYDPLSLAEAWLAVLGVPVLVMLFLGRFRQIIW